MSFSTLAAVDLQSAVARVDLLPPEIGERRALRTRKLLLGGGLLGIALFSGVAVLVTLGHVSTAQDALAVEQDRTARLQAEQQQYAEVPAVLNEVSDVHAAEQTARAYDVPLYGYIDQVATGAPEGLTLNTVDFTISGQADGVATDATGTASATGAVGKVDVTGVTRSQEQVAGWMEHMDGIGGFNGTTLSGSQRDEEGIVTFSTSTSLTSSVLSAGS